jgi:hypothetical protein
MEDSGKETSLKFHGIRVKNIIITHMRRTSDSILVEKLDISTTKYERNESIETINVQVVAEYLTITYYRDEAANVIINRELIPTHSIEHIAVIDL